MKRIHELYIKFHVFIQRNTARDKVIIELEHDGARGVSDAQIRGTCSTTTPTGKSQRPSYPLTFEQDVDRTGRIAALANSKVLLVYDLENPDKVRVPKTQNKPKRLPVPVQKNHVHVSPRSVPSCQRNAGRPGGPAVTLGCYCLIELVLEFKSQVGLTFGFVCKLIRPKEPTAESASCVCATRWRVL